MAAIVHWYNISGKHFCCDSEPMILKFYRDLFNKCITFYLPQWNSHNLMKCSHILWGSVWHFTVSQSLVSLADVKMKNLEFRKENNSSCLVLQTSNHFGCPGPFSWDLWQEDISCYVTTSLIAILFSRIVAHSPQGELIFCCWSMLFIFFF